MISILEVKEIIDTIAGKNNECLQSLAHISRGPNSEAPMLNYPDRFLHYDRIAGIFYKRKPKTPDMVLFKEDALVFVEFKSGKIKPDDIKVKAIEGGFIILNKILKAYKKGMDFIDIFKLKKTYIVVYDKKKNARRRLSFQKGANIVRFGLEIYKGTFFYDVKTLSQKHFEIWLQENRFIAAQGNF